MLYNRFTQRLFSYDLTRKQIESQSDEPNYFQYEFPTASPYMTAGSSATNDFEIIEIDGSEIRDVLTMEKDRGIFPLATNGEDIFFTESRYAADGAELSRTLVRLDAGSLVRYPEATGLITSGVLLDGTLYYTRARADGQRFDLFSLPAADSDATPDKVRSDLTNGALYEHDGRLVFSSPRGIELGNGDLDCRDLCYFDDAHSKLLHLHVDSENALALDIIDLPSGEISASVTGVLDFREDGDRLTVYRSGSIRTIDLAG